VSKVLTKNKAAYGVNYIPDGSSNISTLYAAREVIVSAGVFQTPQILQLSGIGPQSLLQKLGVPVVYANNGVGSNLQDHIAVGLDYRANTDTSTRLIVDAAYAEASLNEYLTQQDGPYAGTPADVIAFEKLNSSALANVRGSAALELFPKLWPHVEYFEVSAYLGNVQFPLASQPTDGYNYVTLGVSIEAPLSRGTVQIQSTDVHKQPLIKTGYLTNLTDVDVLVEGFKRVRQIFSNSAIRPGLADPTEYFPGPSVQTDDEIRTFIQNNVMMLWHAAGTSAMLPEKAGGVVDSSLRVYGVDNLRVVDASIFPLLPPGHPASTVFMAAAKAVDMILADAASSRRHRW